MTHSQDVFPKVSATRNREQALSLLLPKILCILSEKGQPGRRAEPGELVCPGDIIARVNSELEIGVSALREEAVIVHAYLRTDIFNSKKVLSVHLTKQDFGDPQFFRYWDGRCGILSWRRGTWEDAIMAHAIESSEKLDALH